jgi:hypothetical protein
MRVNYFLLLFFSQLIFWGCKNNLPADIEKQYLQMKDKQTKFILHINNNSFYEVDAIFSGHLEAKNNYFVMNFHNQYGGNYILNLSGENWYNEKYIDGRLAGAAASNLMIGKVINKQENIGAGYLMDSGKIEPITVSKAKLIFKVSGSLKKYPKVAETDSSYNFEGYIISKSPEYSEYSIPKQ